MGPILSPMLGTGGFDAGDVSKADLYSDQAPSGPGRFRGFQTLSGGGLSMQIKKSRTHLIFAGIGFIQNPSKGLTRPLPL